MLNKKIKSILFIFLILFCIAAVNAESADEITGIESVNIENVESNREIIAISDANEIAGSFSELNKTINNNTNGTISLDKDYKYSDGDTSFKNGISINRNLTIDGQGYTIDGNRTARIFNVVSGGALTIKNINLINGNSMMGGAIYTQSGNIIVINSNFINNSASQSGGAIYAQTSSVTVINSTFKNSIASQSGGAIYTYNGHVNVTNSNFNNSISTQTGGAIYAYSGNIIINNSNFTNNNATKSNGGGIYTYSGNISVNNSIFTNNTATQSNGGGISTNNGNINIANSIFNGNSAKNGGAVASSNGVITVNNSTFTENNANYGGAIYNGGGTVVNNTSFNDNSANYGGAIYIYKGNVASVSVNVTNSNFYNNTAYYNGGAIGSTNGVITSINSTFTKNTANYGGALFATSTNVISTNSEFNQNKAISGGAIYSNNNVNITNSSFNNNIANYSGGAIQSNNGNVTINKSKFMNNTAPNGGAIYYLNSNSNVYRNISLSIMNTNFSENSGEFGDDIYTTYNTNIMNNTYTKDSYANIYANNTIVNCTDVSVLKNGTYYVTPGSKFKVNATVLADGASVNGYNLTVADGNNKYNATYVGYGVYEIDENITADFTSKSYSAIVNNETDSPNYIVENGTVVVNRNITIDVSLDEAVSGKNITGNITLRDADGNIANITDEVTVRINNKTYTVSVVNGVGKLNIDDKLDACNYTMNVNFKGTQEYNPASITANLTVKKGNPNIDVDNLTKFHGEDGKLNITLTDAEGNIMPFETVFITINGVTYNRTTDANGQISMNIKLNPGTYEVMIAYGNVTKNVTITIKSTVNATDLVKYYRNGTQYYATFYDVDGKPLANTTVIFNINGVTYTRTTDKNGTAKLSINLSPGEYIITAINPVNNQTFSNNITVLSTVVGKDIVKYFRNGTQYYATFLDENGNPIANRNVTFNINGVTYTRTTDENGTAKLSINLDPNEYIITVVNPVNNEAYSNKITVLSTIEGNDIVKYFRNGTQYYATFLDENGNPIANATVSFNINGVTYTRTTDENGIAKLSINLDPNSYIITMTNPTNNQTYSNMITVLSVIESEDLEMTANNRKAFKATILDEQGNPLANTDVTFNINGVFYTRTTNADGVVSLNINLIAGKYIITTYFNGLSQSNTITIK